MKNKEHTHHKQTKNHRFHKNTQIKRSSLNGTCCGIIFAERINIISVSHSHSVLYFMKPNAELGNELSIPKNSLN